ncbi:MAG TPA: helix-turn-helix domain-containing protein [Anaeromyxobacter sp.]|nr:helix-turn-helix domain-containing protein [Anaeromyxobacter sp.]
MTAALHIVDDGACHSRAPRAPANDEACWTRVMGPPRLLSLRAAAGLLGISPGRTLAPLVRAGRVKTVMVGRRARIPMSEVERIEREGTGAPAATPGAPTPCGPAPSAGALSAGILDVVAAI